MTIVRENPLKLFDELVMEDRRGLHLNAFNPTRLNRLDIFALWGHRKGSINRIARMAELTETASPPVVARYHAFEGSLSLVGVKLLDFYSSVAFYRVLELLGEARLADVKASVASVFLEEIAMSDHLDLLHEIHDEVTVLCTDPKVGKSSELQQSLVGPEEMGVFDKVEQEELDFKAKSMKFDLNAFEAVLRELVVLDILAPGLYREAITLG